MEDTVIMEAVMLTAMIVALLAGGVVLAITIACGERNTVYLSRDRRKS